MSLRIDRYFPSRELRPVIKEYWDFSAHITAGALPLVHQVAPHGHIDLVVHLSDCHCEVEDAGGWEPTADFSFIGFWEHSFPLRFHGLVDAFLIRLRPESLLPLFGAPAREFLNRPADLEEVLGEKFRSFCRRLGEAPSVADRIRLTETCLTRQLRRTERQQRDYLREAVALIRRAGGTLSVEDLSRRVFISRRQLEREFRDKIGMSPKQYLRIARFNQAQQVINRNPDWNLTEVSHYSGYADQAHFTREFKRLTGENPSRFLTREPGVTRLPIRSVGSPQSAVPGAEED